ncbi:MAG: RNA polymerase sigma factor, partial [Planctomycetota bacterium]
MSVSDDEQLMLGAAQGDREAFGRLVERHHPGILRFVHRFLGNVDTHTAEDLAQDVFLAAWQAAPSFRPRAKLLTWLLRITTNICLNYRRRSRLRAAVSLTTQGFLSTREGEAGLRSGTERPDAREIAREQAETVSKAIAGLPPKQRIAILLRHFHGL